MPNAQRNQGEEHLAWRNSVLRNPAPQKVNGALRNCEERRRREGERIRMMRWWLPYCTISVSGVVEAWPFTVEVTVTV
jgi:hypothetical protein